MSLQQEKNYWDQIMWGMRMCGTEMQGFNEKKSRRIEGKGAGLSQADKRPGPSLCLSFVWPSCGVVRLSPVWVMLLAAHAQRHTQNKESLSKALRRK